MLALNDRRDRHPEFKAPAAALGDVASPDKYLRELWETTASNNDPCLGLMPGFTTGLPVDNYGLSRRLTADSIGQFDGR